MENNILERFDLSPEEKKALHETQDFDSLAEHPGWLKVREFIAYKVAKAHETMAGNRSGDPKTYMFLQLRWQEQRDMMLAINRYVDEMIETRKELISRSMEEPDEYDPARTDY